MFAFCFSVNEHKTHNIHKFDTKFFLFPYSVLCISFFAPETINTRVTSVYSRSQNFTPKSECAEITPVEKCANISHRGICDKTNDIFVVFGS